MQSENNDDDSQGEDGNDKQDEIEEEFKDEGDIDENKEK